MVLSHHHTYIIAEMACSHEGDTDLALKIIDGAGRAGADAVQFQIWSVKDMVVPNHADYELLTRIELPYDKWRKLAGHVRRHYPQMDIIACVYEANSADFADSIDVDAYKIHSADLSNPDFIQHVARKNRRIDLSTGASTLDEIHTAIEWIKQESQAIPVWLMYGYQVFPTPTDAIHLSFMAKLKQLFELPVGYQDHSDGGSLSGFFLPAAAMGMGVDCLEKHITHDRALKGIDHQAALNPDEFKRFVAMARELDEAMGKNTPRPFSKEETAYRINSKKSIVAAKKITKESVVEKKDLVFLRAASPGLPPDQSSKIIGKLAARDIQPYEIISEDDIK